jgi:hypothetical protein
MINATKVTIAKKSSSDIGINFILLGVFLLFVLISSVYFFGCKLSDTLAVEGKVY